MADRKHTAMEAMEPPLFNPVLKRTVSDSDRRELTRGHHAVLALGDLGNDRVRGPWPTFSRHQVKTSATGWVPPNC